LSGDGLASKAQITQDGRIEVSLNLRKKLPQLPKDWALSVEEFAVDATSYRNVPKLSIVIMIVGSRGRNNHRNIRPLSTKLAGDVQPYIALGRALVTYGHRVRIATHEAFRSFVTDEGLKFFNIGGDPHDLMSYMVRSKLRSCISRATANALQILALYQE
jgi:sterol 3beta-glucosyltransferase